MLKRLWNTAWRRTLGVFLLSLPLAAGAASQAPVRLVVGELPPFAMEGGERGPGSLVEITQELAQRPPADRARLDAAIADLLANFGAHSRNAVRGVLRASPQP